MNEEKIFEMAKEFETEILDLAKKKKLPNNILFLHYLLEWLQLNANDLPSLKRARLKC